MDLRNEQPRAELAEGRLVDGLPTALTGDAAAAATARWEGLRDCAGLAASPGAG